MQAMNLPTLTCSYCMRKVGLWNFHQMEEAVGDKDALPSPASQTVRSTSPLVAAAAAAQEGQGDQPTSASLMPPTTPCRMKLRSQDSTRSEQVCLYD